jgi:hypothetical protein
MRSAPTSPGSLTSYTILPVLKNGSVRPRVHPAKDPQSQSDSTTSPHEVAWFQQIELATMSRLSSAMQWYPSDGTFDAAEIGDDLADLALQGLYTASGT